MVDTYNFYGDAKYFNSVKDRIRKYLESELDCTIEEKAKEKDTFYVNCKKGCLGAIRFELLEPEKNIEYYQHGLKRMIAKWDSFNGVNENIISYLKNISNVFSPAEEEKLWEYTPVLSDLVIEDIGKKDLLNDTIVIFREHSLISVLNVFNVLHQMGLKPENTIYYSKGDRCRNIDRIEATFKDNGYGVFVLSPFESVSKTGKTEDEVILPDAEERVRQELTPYFEKARTNNLKVVIFDDGGLMVTTAIDLFAEKYSDVIYGFIETTKGGMHAINARPDLDVTVINLADCQIKNLMSSVIGHSITHRLREMIPQIGFQSKSAIIVGYGTLGKVIARDLRNQGMAVYVCEVDSVPAYEAVADGYPVSKDLPYLIKNFKPILIMGCTGLDALNYANLSTITDDTFVATVSSNEIKQSYPDFDKNSTLNFIDNYARIYTLKNGAVLTILANGASLNLYNGEGAVHADYQPFLAAMIKTITYCVRNGPVKGKRGLDTEIADQILGESKILDKYLELSKSLLKG